MLTEKQNNAVFYLKDKTTKEVLYGGGAGGGKSYLGCLWLIECCQKYPGTRWMMGRSVLKNLKQTTLKTFFDISSNIGLSNQCTYNEHKGSVLFSNDSEILLKDLYWYKGKDPNFDSLGSLEITGAFIDECNQITRMAKDIVKSRIRYKLKEYGLIPKMLMTCNPSKGWVYDDFYKPSKDNSMPPSKIFIPSLLSDNPHISEHYKDNLSELDEKTKQRLLYGNWDYDDDPTILMDYDSILDCFTNRHVPYGEKYITADIAMQGSDKMVVGYWEGFILIDVNVSLNNDGKQAVDMISSMCNRYGVPQSKVCYDADGIGAFIKGYLPNAKPFVNGSKALNGENYENLKTQCYYNMSDRINGGGVLILHQTYKDDIAQELSSIRSRDEDKEGKIKMIKKEQLKELIGRSPDFADMIAMREYFELKHKRTGAW